MNLKFKYWFIAQLRRVHYKWQPKENAKKLARISRGVYQCAVCNGLFGNKEIQVDHINPVVSPTDGFTCWDDYIKRLFVSTGEYAILCKECHSKKTKKENEGRG